MSTEFMKNETVNVFGSSEVIFDGRTKSEEIVESLMTNFYLHLREYL